MGGGGYHIDPDTSGGNLPGAAERDDGRFCGSSDHQVLAGLAGLDGVRGKDRGEEEKNTELSLLILLPLSYFVGVRTKKFGIYLDKTQIT